MTSFALVARAKKIMALVEYFDALLCARGYNPHETHGAELMVSLLRGLAQGDWIRRSTMCGQHPPSATTQAEVIAVYVRRAAQVIAS